jgi:hypothetical protein
MCSQPTNHTPRADELNRGVTSAQFFQPSNGESLEESYHGEICVGEGATEDLSGRIFARGVSAIGFVGGGVEVKVFCWQIAKGKRGMLIAMR